MKFKKQLLTKKNGKRFYYVSGEVSLFGKVFDFDLLYSYSPSLSKIASGIRSYFYSKIKRELELCHER